MPVFTIETTYRLPMFRQHAYEAETIDPACQLAIADEDWSDARSDVETSGETYVSGVWWGDDAADQSAAAPIPSQCKEMIQRKADHFEALLGILKILAHAPDVTATLRSGGPAPTPPSPRPRRSSLARPIRPDRRLTRHHPSILDRPRRRPRGRDGETRARTARPGSSAAGARCAARPRSDLFLRPGRRPRRSAAAARPTTREARIAWWRAAG